MRKLSSYLIATALSASVAGCGAQTADYSKNQQRPQGAIVLNGIVLNGIVLNGIVLNGLPTNALGTIPGGFQEWAGMAAHSLIQRLVLTGD